MKMCRNGDNREATHGDLCFRCKWDEEDMRGRIQNVKSKVIDKIYVRPFSVREEMKFTKNNRKKIRKQLGL